MRNTRGFIFIDSLVLTEVTNNNVPLSYRKKMNSRFSESAALEVCLVDSDCDVEIPAELAAKSGVLKIDSDGVTTLHLLH